MRKVYTQPNQKRCGTFQGRLPTGFSCSPNKYPRPTTKTASKIVSFLHQKPTPCILVNNLTDGFLQWSVEAGKGHTSRTSRPHHRSHNTKQKPLVHNYIRTKTTPQHPETKRKMTPHLHDRWTHTSPVTELPKAARTICWTGYQIQIWSIYINITYFHSAEQDTASVPPTCWLAASPYIHTHNYL